MQATFTVDVPFVIPTLRFVLERDHRAGAGANGCLLLSCYFDKGREMYALAMRMKSMDDVGRCAQLLAKSAAWTVEVLERWPRDDETGRLTGDMGALNAFLADGKPLFCMCRPGEMASLDAEDRWPV